MPYNLGSVEGAYNVGYAGAYVPVYPYVLTSHGDAHPNSVMANANFASFGTIELRIVSDFDPAKMEVDWQDISDNQLWRQNISGLSAVTVHATEATTDTATIGWHVVETGATREFLVMVSLDAVQPSITSVNILVTGTYTSSAILTFTVTFDDVVHVTGLPVLNLMIGSTARQATYNSGTGSNELRFFYVVQVGDEDNDGIEIVDLAPDGGTIKDLAGNDADLTLVGVADMSAVLVDSGPDDLVTLGATTIRSASATIAFSYPGTDITGFQYSLDSAAWVTTDTPLELSGLTASTAYNLRLRAVNDSGPGVPTLLEFTTNSAVDTTPAQFDLLLSRGQPLSTFTESNAITVTDVSAGVDIPVSVSGDPGSVYAVSTDGGNTWGGWTATPTNVRLNYQIKVGHDTSDEFSSGPYNGNRSTTLDLNGVTDTFNSSTIPDEIPPVVTLEGGNVEHEVGTNWVDPGYTAIDNADGDITNTRVEIIGTVDEFQLGPQEIQYRATDLSENVTTVTRIVTVVESVAEDTEAPVIQLTGGNLTWPLNEPFVDPGYIATDNLTNPVPVDVTGTVDITKAGPNELTYIATDDADNITIATRIVTVVSPVTYAFEDEAPADRTVVCKRMQVSNHQESVFLMQTGEVIDYDFDLDAWLTEQSDDFVLATWEVKETSDSVTIMNSGKVTSGTGRRIKIWVRAEDVDQPGSTLVQLKIKTDDQRVAKFQFQLVLLNRFAA